MNSRQTNSFFIHSSLSGVLTTFLKQQDDKKYGYYQNLIYTSLIRPVKAVEDIDCLARQLATIARQAYLTKHIDVVEQASQIMLALPLSKYFRRVALFYEALCEKCQGNLDNALLSFQQVSEEAIPRYKSRALQNIGATYYERGEVDKALPYYITAGKVAADCDLVTLAESQCMVGIVRYAHGDYKSGVDSMESLFPLVQGISRIHPPLYYIYLNNLAVGLTELGRIAEAQSAISIALASPYSAAYTEWSETRDEIEKKRNYPDLSRCFIDRALTESEAIPETNISSSAASERQLEDAVSRQHQSTAEVKPLRARAFHSSIKPAICQRTVTLPNAAHLFIPGGSAKSILQRLGRSIQLRGPPAFFFRFKSNPKV